MRKLNMKTVLGHGKMMGGAAGAYAYEQMAEQVVMATVNPETGIPTPVGIVMQMVVGWGPFVLAAQYPSPASSAFAGAIAYNRIARLMETLGQLRAQNIASSLR